MSVVYPTKYKQQQQQQEPKIIPAWSMKKDFKDTMVEFSEIKPPIPYPPNRRKPGATLPVPGSIKPYKIMLTAECPDVQKEIVKSLNEIEPRASKAKGKKSKKSKKK